MSDEVIGGAMTQEVARLTDEVEHLEARRGALLAEVDRLRGVADNLADALTLAHEGSAAEAQRLAAMVAEVERARAATVTFHGVEAERDALHVELLAARAEIARGADDTAKLIAAREEIARLLAHLRNALSFAYDACDQTVQCPECEAIWWGVPEDIDENWHASGCGLFAARLAVGEAKDIRRSEAADASRPPRTPAELLRERVVSGWFARLSRMGYGEAPPAGMDAKTWEAAVFEAIRRLLAEAPPAPLPAAEVTT
jgi:hypothetical protein